jgi:putative ABC transport system permease protein
VAIRSEGDPASLVASLRSIVHSIDSQLALDSVETMTEVISRSTADRRFNLLLLGSFAAVALMLAAVGILAYSVTQRTHEIGVRMALGASGGEIVRLVLNYGFRLTLIGSILGIAGGLALTRVVQRFLYEVHPTDLLTFLGVVLLLGGVALAASYVPARRATRVDPMLALRYE